LRRDSIKAILPSSRSKSIDQLKPGGRDDKYTFFNPLLHNKDLLRYDQFWQPTYFTVKILVDSETGEKMLWEGTEEKLKVVRNQFPQLKVLTRQKRTVEQHIIVEDQVMFSGRESAGIDDYPFALELGFFAPESDRGELKVQGLARCLRDPQTEINKRRSKMLDIIDSQISSGWKAEEGSVVNPDSMYKSGQGEVTWMKKGQMKAAEKHRPTEVPQGLFSSIALFDQDIMDISGANSELLGMAESGDVEVAAILAKMRSGAGLTVLQDFFDNHRLTKKILGNKQIKMVQKNYTAKKVALITGKEPTKEFYSKNFGKYDAAVGEGVLTDTQRQMQFAQAMGMKKSGAPIPWSYVLDISPMENKNELKEAAIAEEKAASEGKKQQEQMLQLQIQQMMAKMQSDLANAKEQNAQAVENLTSSRLDRVKAISEIQDMSIEQFMKVFTFLKEFEAQQGGI
jgi:hypothetical protein